MPADDDEFLEEDASEKDKESFDEDVDNDEITPEEEGFLQGYDAAEEKEEKPQGEEEH